MMKIKSKLNKFICASILGISTIGTVGFVSTSCGSKEEEIIHVDRVELNEELMSLTIGNTAVVFATVYPFDATNRSVTWTSK